ncbi:MAG: MSHA biogenesis protein MshP [Gammaproteobacteria bacterium]
MSAHHHRQGGFAYVAAVVLLVVMAGMAATVITLNNTQRANGSHDLLGIRAALVARAGVEWGLYQVRTFNTPYCSQASDTLTTLTDFSDTGFVVSVRCRRTAFNEGSTVAGVQVKYLYRISATACNNSAVCPAPADVVAAVDYVERRRVATVCTTATPGVDCY